MLSACVLPLDCFSVASNYPPRPGRKTGAVSLTVKPNRITLNAGQTQRFAAHIEGAPTGTVIFWAVPDSLTVLRKVNGTHASQVAAPTISAAGGKRIAAAQRAPLGESKGKRPRSHPNERCQRHPAGRSQPHRVRGGLG